MLLFPRQLTYSTRAFPSAVVVMGSVVGVWGCERTKKRGGFLFSRGSAKVQYPMTKLSVGRILHSHVLRGIMGAEDPRSNTVCEG